MHLPKILERIAIPFLRKHIVPAAKLVGADLLEFAAPPGIAEVDSGKKNFKTAAKSEGSQTLSKQLGSGSRKQTPGRVIPTRSAKQISRSRRHIFANISQLTCRAIFGSNQLWQFLEILEGNSQ